MRRQHDVRVCKRRLDLLKRVEDGDVGIEVIVVAPAFRVGAANVLLLEAATRTALDGGAERFRFFCDDRTRDTLGLARRAGASPTRIDAEYRRALT